MFILLEPASTVCLLKEHLKLNPILRYFLNFAIFQGFSYTLVVVFKKVCYYIGINFVLNSKPLGFFYLTY